MLVLLVGEGTKVGIIVASDESSLTDAAIFIHLKLNLFSGLLKLGLQLCSRLGGKGAALRRPPPPALASQRQRILEI